MLVGMVQRTSFQKLQRERAKKAKAERKREERQNPESALEEVVELPEEGEEIPPEQLLVLVEQLHKDFDDKRISFEEFEERKAELMARLVV